MSLAADQFFALLRKKEGPQLEYKEAKEDFIFEKAFRCAVALEKSEVPAGADAHG